MSRFLDSYQGHAVLDVESDYRTSLRGSHLKHALVVTPPLRGTVDVDHIMAALGKNIRQAFPNMFVKQEFRRHTHASVCLKILR